MEKKTIFKLKDTVQGINKNIAYLINFDKPLPENVIEEVRLTYRDIDELVVIDKQITIKLHKPIYIQCVDVRKELQEEYEDIFSMESVVIVNLPGFSMAAVYLINEIEAVLHHKPFILELIKKKTSNTLFNNFEFRRIFNLEYNKHISRTNSSIDSGYREEQELD